MGREQVRAEEREEQSSVTQQWTRIQSRSAEVLMGGQRTQREKKYV